MASFFVIASNYCKCLRRRRINQLLLVNVFWSIVVILILLYHQNDKRPQSIQPKWKPPDILPKPALNLPLNYSGRLQPAGSNLSQLLVSFVFIDPRFTDRVRLIAVGRVSVAKGIFCHFHLSNGSNITTASLSSEPIIKQHKLSYDGIFIDCPSPVDVDEHSFLLSLSSNKYRHGDAYFKVYHISYTPPSEPSIALCLAPLHNQIEPFHLIAWMEMNRLIGVTHFVFYNYSMSDRIVPVLHHYNRLGILELVQWDTSPIPTMTVGTWPPNASSLHYYGQFPASNDCLYRLGDRYRYIMFTDLDEMIVHSNNYSSLSELLTREDSDEIAEFKFRMTYMRSDFPEEPSLSLRPEDRVIFVRRTWRETRVLSSKIGPKVVVKFPNALVMGVHELIATASLKTVTRVIKPSQALLLHYRDPPGYLVANISGLQETRVMSLLPRLRAAMNERLKQINLRL